MSDSDMMAKAQLIDRHYELTVKATKGTDKLRKAAEAVALFKKQIKEREQQEWMNPLKEQADSISKSIELILNKINPPKDMQGFSRNPALVDTQLNTARRLLQNTLFPATKTQETLLNQTEKNVVPVLDEIDEFFKNDWAAFKDAVESSQFSWFEEF